MIVPFVDLGAQWSAIEDEAIEEIKKVLRGGKSVGDPIIEIFENEVSEYLGIRNCITLNSGTDALLFGLMVLGIGKGDEVITVANSFIASTAAIAHVGAKPVFVDVGPDHLINPELIESAISTKTKAIMPVHLEGKMCNMPSIKKIADKYNLAVIEDAAQSFGSKYDNWSAGQLSDIACFSFHPLKNLNGIGDGGFIATNNHQLASRVRNLRNHGLIDRNTASEFGFASRLDSLQACVLRIRLSKLDTVIEKRKYLASIYNEKISNSQIQIPVISKLSTHTYHLYVIETEDRSNLQEYLEENGIQTKIHYPKLICDQPAFMSRFGSLNFDLRNTRLQSNKILSLPIHQNLSDDQMEFIIKHINYFQNTHFS